MLAVYHPRNRYVLHLSSDASSNEREWLVAAVRSVPAIQAFENVEVIGKPIWLTDMGATNIAATLRAAAILLKLDDGWDWFITLSASDYPLLTQDGMFFNFLILGIFPLVIFYCYHDFSSIVSLMREICCQNLTFAHVSPFLISFNGCVWFSQHHAKYHHIHQVASGWFWGHMHATPPLLEIKKSCF